MRKCEYCGSFIPDDSYTCPGCGAKSAPVKTEEKTESAPEKTTLDRANEKLEKFENSVSEKLADKRVMRALVLFILTITLGFFGVHRFMQRKIFTGLLWLCTGGLFTVGYFIDSIINFVGLMKLIIHNKHL